MQIRVERLSPPDQLMTCAAAPAVPDTKEQGPVAEYLADLWDAGEDCRAKLKAVRQWVKDNAKS